MIMRSASSFATISADMRFPKNLSGNVFATAMRDDGLSVKKSSVI